MGTEQSRHKRRHTVPVNTPYIKHPNQTDLPQIVKLDNPKDGISPTNAHSNRINGAKSYSIDFGIPNKMTRSVSTPAYTHPHPMTRETIDHDPSTPNQHLITSLPSNIKQDSLKIKKKKLGRNPFLPSFKKKIKRHNRNHSAVPYVHFTDDSAPDMARAPHIPHAKSFDPQQKTRHRSWRKKKKHAFSADDMEIEDSDVSYHSDPGYIDRNKISFTEQDDHKNKRKILLLGNGSSGKSTIFKQLKLILGDKECFDANELSEATHAIRQNCVSVLLLVLHKSTVLYALNNKYFSECHIDETNDVIRDAIHYVMKYRSESFEVVDNATDLSKLSHNIGFLWSLPCVQTAIAVRHKRFSIPDNICYFYNEIWSIFDSDYVPSIEDMLRLRIRTTGMIESKYNIDGYNISLFDTGGERNERKKWIHTFENVDVVIYVAALSHFCTVLWEDEKTISMHDAIELFDEICNGRWFRRSEMILFLNKNDIFRQLLYDEISLSVGFADINHEDYCVKLSHCSITPPPQSPHCIDDNNDNNNDIDDEFIPFSNLNAWQGDKWIGPNFKYDSRKSEEENNVYFEKCYDKAIEFMVSLFLKQNRDENKTVYVHITTAVDNNNIKQVWDEIRPLIIHSNYAGHCKHFF